MAARKVALWVAAVSLALAAAAPVSAAGYLLEEVEPMLSKLDIDGDGSIDRYELYLEDPALVAGFDRADLDRDGTLGLREFEILLMSS
jgi:hypothetical protein